MDKKAYVFLDSLDVLPSLSEVLDTVDLNYKLAKEFTEEDAKELGYDTLDDFRAQFGIDDKTVQKVKDSIVELYDMNILDKEKANILEDSFGKYIELFDFKSASEIRLPVVQSLLKEAQLPVPEIVYTYTLKRLGESLKKPYYTISPEELFSSEIFELAKDLVISNIHHLNLKYIQEDPKSQLIAMPSTDEIKKGLEEALNRAIEREKSRLESERAKEVFTEEVHIPGYAIPSLTELFEESPELRDIFTHPVGWPEPLPGYTYLEFASPDIIIFDLDEFAKTFNLTKPTKDILKKYLAEQDFHPSVGERYHLKGKKQYEEFKNIVYSIFPISISFPFPKRSASSTYFNLFKEFDVKGSPWVLDENSKKIVKQVVDIEKAIREGGVWEYKKGMQVYVNSDFQCFPVTIIALLPNRKYLVKSNNTGQEFTVCENDLFTLEKIY